MPAEKKVAPMVEKIVFANLPSYLAAKTGELRLPAKKRALWLGLDPSLVRLFRPGKELTAL
jgi:hypothetical protein